MHSAHLHEAAQVTVRYPAQPCQVHYSVVVPVYRNEANIDDLLKALHQLFFELAELEVVFVVDGSPDRSAEKLPHDLRVVAFEWQLVELSRNFGSFAAIRQGLALARGEFVAVLAADLQELPDLISVFFRELRNDGCDLAVVCVLRGRTRR